MSAFIRLEENGRNRVMVAGLGFILTGLTFILSVLT